MHKQHFVCSEVPLTDGNVASIHARCPPSEASVEPRMRCERAAAHSCLVDAEPEPCAARARRQLHPAVSHRGARKRRHAGAVHHQCLRRGHDRGSGRRQDVVRLERDQRARFPVAGDHRHTSYNFCATANVSTRKIKPKAVDVLCHCSVAQLFRHLQISFRSPSQPHVQRRSMPMVRPMVSTESEEAQ